MRGWTESAAAESPVPLPFPQVPVNAVCFIRDTFKGSGSESLDCLSHINDIACTVVDVDALGESDPGGVALQFRLLRRGQQGRLPAGGL